MTISSDWDKCQREVMSTKINLAYHTKTSRGAYHTQPLYPYKGLVLGGLWILISHSTTLLLTGTRTSLSHVFSSDTSSFEHKGKHFDTQEKHWNF
ncbi:hypothetical protein MTR_8g079325 [Medicago truncatula]|uniref:Uncharacterized protein n=1 Tax=Medicago truncatula TaxID=3880 RepID=A0A072TSW2_MEDTR|nr:hypothetical protein MTR_8g079325 [Medicago truncatula]